MFSKQNFPVSHPFFYGCRIVEEGGHLVDDGLAERAAHHARVEELVRRPGAEVGNLNFSPTPKNRLLPPWKNENREE